MQLGRKGLEKVIEYKLEPEEKEALEKSATGVKESIGMLRTLVNF